jgi:uncharacterized protein (DUF1501 family)
MQRRSLLQSAAVGAAGVLGLSGRLFAASRTDGNRFLLVFLRGGYDAASLLVPVASGFYYSVRPNIAIARPSDAITSALPLTADWGLHPALRGSVFPLVQRGHAAFIPFAGTNDSSRSHFETQDSIELGQPLEGRRDLGSGFMNRLASELGTRDAIAFTDQLPLTLRGTASVANISVKSVGKSGIDAKARTLLSQMYGGHALSAQVAEGFEVRDEVSREMSSEMEAANRGAVTTKGFEGEARRIARLMRVRYPVGFIDVGGWDTHVGQGGASGTLATRLDELGRGLAAYADEMGESAWRKTVVVVVSEFGRTLRENGNRGTDHGHGSVYWVLGGGLTSPSVVGEQVVVEQKTLFQNRDYPVLNEYRAVLGGLFQREFGLSAASLERVFPGAKPKDLRLL